MKKLSSLSFLALLVLLAGCMNTSSPSTDGQSGQDTTPETSQEVVMSGDDAQDTDQDFSGTLADVWKQGRALTCTFETSGDGYTHHGKIVSDGKQLYFSNTTRNDQEGVDHTGYGLVTQDALYARNYALDTNQGFGFKIPRDEDDDDLTDIDGLEDSSYFNCVPGADTSLFVLPSNIKFSEHNSRG